MLGVQGGVLSSTNRVVSKMIYLVIQTNITYLKYGILFAKAYIIELRLD